MPQVNNRMHPETGKPAGSRKQKRNCKTLWQIRFCYNHRTIIKMKSEIRSVCYDSENSMHTIRPW